MYLQKNFVDSVNLFFKEKGKEWLDSLPELIAYCEEKWSLTMRDPYSLSVNYVAPAIKEDGTEVVVKICIPGEDFLDELEALRLFKDQGMASLLDYDQEKGIFILEKLSPGHTLAEVTDHAEACRCAAHVMSNLIVPAPSETRLPTTKGREENLRRTYNQNQNGYGPFSKETLEKALNVFTYLNQTIEKYWLLHGDFHHYNILASEDEWLAIDPKGVVGEVEYDLIQYMLNRLPDEGVYDVTKTRVDVFTEELNLNKERLILYGYCHTVLSTTWTVDDDGSYEGNFHQVVAIFEKMYESTYGKSIEDRLLEGEF